MTSEIILWSYAFQKWLLVGCLDLEPCYLSLRLLWVWTVVVVVSSGGGGGGGDHGGV